LKKQDARVDELLAGGTLGGPHYDEILKRVLAATTPPPRPLWKRVLRWVAIPGAVLVPAAAAWLVLVRPGVPSITPKGSPGTAAVQIGCGTSGGPVCRAGDTLMFSVNAAIVSGYLGAYAERAGDPARERIWYFPTSSGAAPLIRSAGGTIVLPEGVRIGPEHRPGTYRVTTWIADRPLKRAEIQAGEDGAPFGRSTTDLQVLP
jgi:hypothetical protein